MPYFNVTFHLSLVDLISASLLVQSPININNSIKCDENNNSNSTSSTDAEKPSSVVLNDDDEKSEKIKPKQMVGLFPLDLRSELKQRIGGGKSGFSLKKSSTNIDVVRKREEATTTKPTTSVPIPINNNNDLLRRSVMTINKKKSVDSDDDEDGGVENLSFKEKLQLIERSSSRSLVNPL